eukprot:scaffold3565_cov73-Skeletonema_marinoi.AAC.1
MLGFKLANVYDGSALGVNSSASGGGNDKAARGVYMFKLADPSSGPAAVPVDASKDDDVKRSDGGENKEGDNVTSAKSSNAAADSKRVMLLIESGVRFHPTT